MNTKLKNSYPTYLDYASTTPLDERVLEAMLPFFRNDYGNPSSISHTYGEIAKKTVALARGDIASVINALPEEIYSTSGATESINLAIKGIFQTYKTKGKHIITVQTEHKAVLDTCAYLESIGAEITYLSVDSNGLIDLTALSLAIRSDTILVSIMAANNETGVIQDIEQIGAICKEKNTIFFTDATQVFGKIPLDVLKLNIDMLCFSGHKIYGPKGVGGIYIKNGIKPHPQVHGGGHQSGMRSGTLNVPGIVGLAKAAILSAELMETEANNLQKLRDNFERKLVGGKIIKVNGIGAPRLPHISNFQLLQIDADEFIVRNKKNIAVAQGSACNSAIIQPSHVLKGMSLSDFEANNSLRISFGRFNDHNLNYLLELFN